MIIDVDLVARLESSAAGVEVATADSFARVPGDPARSRRIGDGAMVALGPGRFVNRTLGVTLGGLDDDALGEIEAFYAAAGLAPSIEVGSWSSEPPLELLGQRGYRTEFFLDVFALRPDDAARAVVDLRDRAAGPPGEITTTVVTDETVPRWQQLLAEANEIPNAALRTVSDEYARAVHGVPGAVDLIAERDGVPVGCASLVVADGVGWLGGAATLPAHRGTGVQSALITARAARGVELGCTVLAVEAEPASASARNLRRHGFTHVYTKAIMTRTAA